ncbi:MAG: hypothetical protein WC314_26210, partial [Vulcanimicrobiota bacterium]
MSTNANALINIALYVLAVLPVVRSRSVREARQAAFTATLASTLISFLFLLVQAPGHWSAPFALMVSVIGLA